MIINLIGIPFKEKDCFQIAREAYKIINNYDMLQTTIKHNECEKVAKAFMDEATKWNKTTQKAGTVVAIRLDPKYPKLVTHFGVMIDDFKMIHTKKSTGCLIESVNKYSKMIEGFYTHK